MVTLSVDIETYSNIDLKKSGVFPYAASPDFRVLLFGYAVDDGPVQVVDLASGEEIPSTIIEALFDPSVIKTAFNAAFERACLAIHFGREMPAAQWACTQAHALTLGLPMRLGDVAKALNLPADKQKDRNGLALIRYFCIPQKRSTDPSLFGGNPEHYNRNWPQDNSIKWAQFKDYCAQDVAVERTIRKTLEKHPVIEAEQTLWELDQKINQHGVEVDAALVSHAIKCADAYQAKMIAEAVNLTGLANPNSVTMLKAWLKSTADLDVESLNKAAIPELLKGTDNDTVKRVLEIRQELSKTSVKKYEAMDKSKCADNRIRGLFQYYGANRSGRWAGRLVQVQNLPQNKMKDLDLAREMLRAGYYGGLEMLWDSVPNVLSQLIRTALVAGEGKQFIVSDFSAIEARIIAWLAGEEWRMEVFRTHGKIYEASASQMFRVPIEEITKGNPLRQKGKVAELACIAEDQPVLTDRGPVPIQDVIKEDRVWDGRAWVFHQGVVYRGVKEVIEYDGLTATADHRVWVEGSPGPIRFGDAAAMRARLLRTGNCRVAIWAGRNYQPGKALEQDLEPRLRTDPLCWLRRVTMDGALQPDPRQVQGVSSVLTSATNTEVAGPETDRGQAALHEPAGRGVQKLWWSWYKVLLRFCHGRGAVDDRELRAARQAHGDRPDQHGRELCTGEPALGDTPTELRKSTPVYDILNAGPLNRFTVSDCLVHNCGYGGSVGALKAMGALEMGLTEEELPALIKGWRKANPNIVKLWWNTEAAAMEALQGGTGSTGAGRVTFHYKDGILFANLPGGRSLCYVNPRIEPDLRFGGKDTITYEGYNLGRWSRLKTYGPKLVENLIQGIARDALAAAMIRLDRAGFKIVLHVHDEVVIEAPADAGAERLAGICDLMGRDLPWAPGLPLPADGDVMQYYQKM